MNYANHYGYSKVGLDPDKYDFINWTITCDVQVKEEDEA